jgi:hypothetical protein
VVRDASDGPANADDEADVNTSPNLSEQGADNRARADRISQLRGEFLSEVEDLSEHLALLFRAFFEVPNRKAFRFTGLLVKPLSFFQRVECFKVICGRPEGDDFEDYRHAIGLLDQVRTYRNFVAHSRVDLDVVAVLEGRPAPVVAQWRARNGKRRQQEITAKDLELEITRAHFALLIVTCVTSEVVEHPEREVDPTVVMERFRSNLESDDVAVEVSEGFLNLLPLSGEPPEDYDGPLASDFDMDLGY